MTSCLLRVRFGIEKTIFRGYYSAGMARVLFYDNIVLGLDGH